MEGQRIYFSYYNNNVCGSLLNFPWLPYHFITIMNFSLN